MGSNREEFRDSDVNSGRYSEDYGCSFIGVIASLIVIVGLLIVILGINASNVVITPGEFIPNPDFEIIFVPESALVPSLVLLVVIIYWLYSRRNRSALDAA